MSGVPLPRRGKSGSTVALVIVVVFLAFAVGYSIGRSQRPAPPTPERQLAGAAGVPIRISYVDESISAGDSSLGEVALVGRKARPGGEVIHLVHQDPKGLLEWAAEHAFIPEEESEGTFAVKSKEGTGGGEVYTHGYSDRGDYSREPGTLTINP